jgi:hypothetical protein
MWNFSGIFFTATVLAALPLAAHAEVTISKNPTHNMTCSGGVCASTAANAVLNAADLANMLGSGDVKVTTGSGATNIVVKASIGWASTSRLTLDAMQSVEIDKPVTVTGTGGVTVTTNDGGSGGDLMFDGKGAVTFWDLSSSLIINGNAFALVSNIATLASDVTANPTGFYALANDYDASADGTYTSIPISTEFFGVFEGLGHVISNLAIHSPDFSVGLFQEVQGTLRDVGLAKASISTNGSKAIAGTLLAVSDQATIVGCYASGAVVSGDSAAAGGLVGGSRSISDGTIIRSHTSVNVSGADGSVVGGLVGSSGFSISLSYATGKVTGGGNSAVGGLLGYGENRATQSYATGKVIGGANSTVGGLVAVAESTGITNSYATGAVKAGDGSKVGGFAGEIETMIHTSYSTGHVSDKSAAHSGGLIGQVDQNSTLDHDYWDTETSGKNGHQGCDDQRCGGQSKGRTTEQLQSGLPEGFDPNIWGEAGGINGGLPYLLAIPPRQ